MLGSGFSASCGLPTQSQLFELLLKVPVEYPKRDSDVQSALKTLTLFFPHFRENSYGYPPFEQFLSLLEASSDAGLSGEEGSLSIFPSEQQQEVRTGCLRLLRAALVSKLSFCDQSKSAVQEFVRCLRGGDAVITFNWDTLVEQELVHAKKQFVFGPGNQECITVLKLHGSLAWCRLDDIGRLPSDHQSRFQKIDDSPEAACFLRSEYLSDQRVLLEMPLPCIVLPVYQKEPTRDWLMKIMWEQAYDRLGRAAEDPSSKIVIIGYSLPPEDHHARLLLRMGIGACGDDKKTLHVIDPDPEVAARYFTSITPRIKFHRRRFMGDELQEILSESVG